MTKIVGITGFQRSGKGTVADILSESEEFGVVYQLGFADKLKRLLAYALDYGGNDPRAQIAAMDDYKLHGELASQERDGRLTRPGSHKTITGRQLHQRVGGGARAIFGEDFWVNYVLPAPEPYWIDGECYEATDDEKAHQLDVMFGGIDLVVVTDVRHRNEMGRIREWGGVNWHVVRPGVESDGDESERVPPKELIDWDITNDGALDGLREQVNQAIRETLTC
jgi:hypothetical protein